MTKRQVLILVTFLTGIAVLISLGHNQGNQVAIWLYGFTAGMTITTQVLRLEQS